MNETAPQNTVLYSGTALLAHSVKANALEAQNENFLVQYGCTMCDKIFLSEGLCHQHITKCARNTLTTQDLLEETSKSDTYKRKLDQCGGKSGSASIFEDSGSDISDNEQENKEGKKCKIELNEEQEDVALESTVYEVTSQMLSQNEMLITLPYDQINDSTGGPLDFSNDVAIAFEQHSQEIIDFEENLKPNAYNEIQDEGAVTIENYVLEDFSTIDRDTTIEILSAFTSKSSQDCPSKSGENGDSPRIGTDNVVEDVETADSENNKVLTVLNTVYVNQLGANADDVTVIDILKRTEDETSKAGSFEVERERQSEVKDNENLEKMGVENRTPVDEGIKGDNKNGAVSPNSQADKANPKKIYLLYKEIHKMTPPQKRGNKRSNRSGIAKKRKNSKNVQNPPDLEKYKEFLEQHAKYKSDIRKKQITKKLQKNRQDQDEVFREDKLLYSQIVCQKEEKDPEEEPNELSVYEFYDEEEEKLKAQMRKNWEIEQEIKKRTCKFCKGIFNDPIEVLRHKRESHKFKRVIMTREEIEPYLEAKGRTECPLCFMKLGSKVFNGNYLKHVMTHCDEYNFQCRVCHLQFRRKDHWTIHEARHVVAPQVADKG